MPDLARAERRRQFCRRCGQFMFEFFRSPDGHFGLVAAPGEGGAEGGLARNGVRCPTCGAGYRLLDRLSAQGQPIERE